MILPRPLLYEAVGLGMTAYARGVHRAVAIGAERLRLEPGAVLVSTHLSDADVPVLAGTLYGAERLWRRPDVVRPSFAVRNDLLTPGYLAGYPPRMPRVLRRALWPLDIGDVMERQVRCLPIRLADRLRLVEVLRAVPDLELASGLPPRRLEPLLARAAALGHPRPVRARDVLRADYADLLWIDVTRAELGSPLLADMWGGQLHASALDLRRLIRHVREGGALVVFPQGEISASGEVGPLLPRSSGLVRSARPAVVQALGVVHDDLTHGRPRSFVGVGAPVDTPSRADGDAELLAALRGAVPLTGGLVVAAEAVRAGSVPPAVAVEEQLAQSLAGARAADRPVEPALEDARSRAARIAEAVQAVERRGVDHPTVARMARTWASVHDADRKAVA